MFRFQEIIYVPPWAFLVSRNETDGLRALFLSPFTWIFRFNLFLTWGVTRGISTLRGIRSRLALKVEGLARVSKNAGGRPRLASVAFDGRYMGLAL